MMKNQILVGKNEFEQNTFYYKHSGISKSFLWRFYMVNKGFLWNVGIFLDGQIYLTITVTICTYNVI